MKILNKILCSIEIIKSILKYKLILFVIIFMIPTYYVKSQDVKTFIHKDKNPNNTSFSIGTQTGYTYENMENRLSPHFRFGINTYKTTCQKIFLNAEIEYYNTTGYWGGRTFDYKNHIYILQNGNKVNSFSLDLIISKLITTRAFVGAGVGLEYISIKTVVNNERYFFYIDSKDRFVFKKGEEKKYRFFAPDIMLTTEYRIPVRKPVSLYFKLKYKLTYIGKNYHAHPLDSWISFTFFTGIRLKL